MPVSCVPVSSAAVCAGGAAGSCGLGRGVQRAHWAGSTWVVSLGDPAGDAVGPPCPRGAGEA